MSKQKLVPIPSYFTATQKQWLVDESAKTGDSIASILRRLVQKEMKK